jgi:hypothetical protein
VAGSPPFYRNRQYVPYGAHILPISDLRSESAFPAQF